MRRILGLLILIVTFALMLRHLARRAFGAVRRDSGSRRSAAGQTRHGELVRDKVCNTFLPSEKALRRSSSDGILYFCSEECLERYTSGADGLAGGKDARQIASISPS